MDSTPRTLAGRYALAAVIGRGGMGAVYRATDLVLGRTVAVKILPEDLADSDPTSVARFEREARAAAALNHPSVVAVYDTGADEDERFIVMELVSGRSLDVILREDGPLEPGRATSVAAHVAEALSLAHAAGIVHRDIKPGNVMITDDGTVKVLDFGIAQTLDGTALTQSSSVVGTAAYMSPEQVHGSPADERSDIYALGCVLYALLAGHPPFRAEHAAAVLHQHANVAPTPLSNQDGRISPRLDALVMRMLAKAPADRPQTAAEVSELLSDGFESSRDDGATRRMTSAPTAQTRLLRPAADEARPGGGNSRRRVLVVGALAAAVLAGAVVALAAGGSTPRPAAGAHRPTTGHSTTAARSAVATTTASSTTTPPTTTAPTTSHQTSTTTRRPSRVQPER